MKKSMLAAAAAFCAFSGAATADEEAEPLTRAMQMGDQRLSCDQLIAEAGRMEGILGGSPAEGLMDGEAMANVGTGIAQQAAIMGGAGKAAGAIGAVGGILGRNSKRKKQEMLEQQALAEKRWIYVVGLYQGKDCDNVPASEGAQ